MVRAENTVFSFSKTSAGEEEQEEEVSNAVNI